MEMGLKWRFLPEKRGSKEMGRYERESWLEAVITMLCRAGQARVTDAATNTTTFAYDPVTCRRVAATDALGQATHTAYDVQGRRGFKTQVTLQACDEASTSQPRISSALSLLPASRGDAATTPPYLSLREPCASVRSKSPVSPAFVGVP